MKIYEVTIVNRNFIDSSVNTGIKRFPCFAAAKAWVDVDLHQSGADVTELNANDEKETLNAFSYNCDGEINYDLEILDTNNVKYDLTIDDVFNAVDNNGSGDTIAYQAYNRVFEVELGTEKYNCNGDIISFKGWEITFDCIAYDEQIGWYENDTGNYVDVTLTDDGHVKTCKQILDINDNYQDIDGEVHRFVEFGVAKLIKKLSDTEYIAKMDNGDIVVFGTRSNRPWSKLGVNNNLITIKFATAEEAEDWYDIKKGGSK